MVDLSKLSGDLRGRIEKIMAGDGKDAKKIDSKNERNQLAELLSGSEKSPRNKDSKKLSKKEIIDFINNLEKNSTNKNEIEPDRLKKAGFNSKEEFIKFVKELCKNQDKTTPREKK